MANPDPPHRPPFSVFGPEPPQHTDQCIIDAARFGFCEHTRLYANRLQRRKNAHAPVAVRVATRPLWRAQHPVLASVCGTVAIGCLIAMFVFLDRRLGPWVALGVFNVITAGWLILMFTGVPSWLTTDLSKVLPPRRMYPKD